MKKSTLILAMALLFVTVCFTSCDKELQEEGLMSKHEVSTNPYRVPLNDALTTATNMLRHIDRAGTRASRTVESVEYVISTTPTRNTEGADTLFYLVNYSNDDGFALLGADYRVDPLFAISDKGSLNISDTTENKGLALFVQQAEYYAKKAIENSEQATRSDTGAGTLEPPTFGDRKITYYTKVLPMLAEYPSNWGQLYPYNLYTGNYPHTVPIGCVPVACTQIMSYYKWPSKLDGLSIDWNYIINYEYLDDNLNLRCPDVLARIFQKVGLILNATYEGDQTSVTDTDLRANFGKLGYASLGALKSLTHTQASKDIIKSPLLVLGYSSINGKKSNVGHCWVIDGYLSYKEEWDAIANPQHTLFYSLYHCVWGWNGENNGYFRWEDNEIVSTDPYNYADTDLGIAPNNNYRTYCDLAYFSDFKPLK